MSDLRAAVKTAIENDVTLAALLTGGVFDVREISKSGTPGAFDEDKQIQPCALVKFPADTVDGPRGLAGRLAVDIYLYEFNSYATIDQALPALYSLFHLQKVGVAADGVWEMRWANDVRDQEDSALRTNMHLSRYEIFRKR